MQRLTESLDEFVVKAEEINIEPPRPVSVRFTGEVEVLKPLEGWAGPAKAVASETFALPEPSGLSWFHRSLVAGGAFTLGAVILASAVFIGMYEGAVQPGSDPAEVAELATGLQSDDRLLPAEGPLASEIFTTTSSEPTEANSHSSSELRKPQSTFRIRKGPRSAFKSSARPGVRFDEYRQKSRKHRSPPIVSAFVPTTLVIYIENGEIKTRIEPQLTGYSKPPTLSN